MLNKEVKRAILEAKNKKEKLITEESLVRNRILMIVESENNIKNFKSLPQGKKEKIASKLIQEIQYLQETNLLNEQLMDFLGKIFGNSFGSVIETIVEPLVNSILSSIGLSGYFKDFLVSFLTSNPGELAKALKDCNTLTKLIAESLGEAIVMMIQKQQGLEGQGYTFLRNALEGAVKNTAFSQSIEKEIESIVCQVFGKMNNKASGVYDKLKGDITGGLGGLVTSVAQPK